MTPQHALVEHLIRLRARDDRAALAVLRRAAAADPGALSDAFPHVLPWVPERARHSRGEDSYFLVASLFAIHPEHGGGGNFGASMWRIATDGSDEPSPSADLRFRRILEAAREDLAAPLRQAVRLAASRSVPVPVDYHRLLSDLLWWDHPERTVQRAWARAYWTPHVSNTTEGE